MLFDNAICVNFNVRGISEVLKKITVYSACSFFLFCALIFTGCFREKDEVTATIQFWSFPNFSSDSGVAGEFENSLIHAFQSQYPSIKVEYTLLNSSDGQAKLDEAIKNGKTPDVFYDAPGRIIVFANQKLLVSLDDILATEKPYITVGLLSVSQGKDRRTYMYPMHEGAFSMAFNKEMLEDLDLIDLLPYKRKDRRWTLEEYETLLKELREKLPQDKVPGVFYYKNQAGDQGTRAFLVNLHGNANLLNGDYSSYIYNSENAKKNIAWTLKAMKEGWLKDGAELTSNDAIQMFAKSEAAHTILYSPQLNKMYNGKRNYKGSDFTPIYMPFPNNSSAPSLEFLAGGACIFDNKDDARLKAAKLFVSFMGKDEEWSAKLVKATGGFPASSKVEIVEDDAEILYNSVLQRFFGQYYNNITGFAKMREYWNESLKAASRGEEIEAVLNRFVMNANSTLHEN